MALSMNGVTVSGKASIGKVPSAGYRYFRVNVTGNYDPSYQAVRFQAIRIKVGATEYPWAVPGAGAGMTSDTTPSPLVASASSVFAGGFEAYQAFVNVFGGNDSYRWISGNGGGVPQWIQIDLGSGNEISPTSLQLCADANWPDSYVTNFTFLASNTGAFTGEETILYTSATLVSGNWAASSFTTFTF